MTIETNDIQALDLLSSPKVPLLRLRRRVKWPESRGQVPEESDASDYYEPAAWWECNYGPPSVDGTQRHLMGEIQLRTELKPSSAMAQFRVQVSLDSAAHRCSANTRLFTTLVFRSALSFLHRGL